MEEKVESKPNPTPLQPDDVQLLTFKCAPGEAYEIEAVLTL